MKKALQLLQQLEKIIIAVTFVVMVISCFIQVVNRNIFKVPVTGFEEAAKFSMVYMVLLGTELGLRDGTQIAITGIIDKIPGITGRIIKMIPRAVVIIFSGVMTSAGWGIVIKQTKVGQTSPGLHLPMGIPYFALVLGFGIITLVQIAYLLRDIRDIRKAEQEGGKA